MLGHIKVGDKERAVYNGRVINDSNYYRDSQDEQQYYFNHRECSELLRDELLENLPSEGILVAITIISAHKEFTENLFLDDAITTLYVLKQKKYEISFSGKINLQKWSKVYTVKQIIEKMKQFNKEYENLDFWIIDETTIEEIQISMVINDRDITIREAENTLLDAINKLYLSALEDVLKETDSVVFEFQVDDSIKIPCKQYLDYFIQFLQDIGIEARGNIYEKVNKILFEVEPMNKDTALDSIRKCLSIYLGLIDNKEIEECDVYENVAYMQLKANINHLKSQLMLAQATIEQKQISIDLLKNLVNQYELAKEEKDNSDKELDVLNGLVTISEVDCKVFKVNLGRLLKVLRRK